MHFLLTFLYAVFSLQEGTGTPNNSIVGTVNATDADGDTLTFSVVSNVGEPRFDSVNGGEQIQLLGPELNYEQNQK